jgi:tetratricopeptide (TPR) repeat protein
VAATFGLTWWGVNTSAVRFGMWPYRNPYVLQPIVVAGGTTINYSRPLIVTQQDVEAEQAAFSAGALPPDPDQFDELDPALNEFYKGNFAEALTLTEQALAIHPQDSVLHEFRALVLFALGRFQEAAEPLYAVLSVGPGWDWTTLASMYPSVDIYTEQLRALEEYVRTNPDDAAPRFVLAYHYLTAGHTEAAARQFQEAARLNPEDQVSEMLFSVLTGDDSALPPAPFDAEGTQTSDVQVPIDSLIGTWTATHPDGPTFSLKLSDDGSFEWTFADGDEKQAIEGVFDVEGAVLAMEPDAGGVLLSEITAPENGEFSFTQIGAPPDEPSLVFRAAR